MSRMLEWSTAAFTALTLTLAGMIGTGSASAASWDENYFPNLPLVTHTGETVRFYDDLIKGKIVVVNFIYTSCGDICPLMTARMVQIQKRLGDRVGRDIFIYSISIDPVHDTPERLNEYVQAFPIKPGWLFLTGTWKDIKVIRHKLGERSRSLAEHRNDAVLGNDATGEWTRVSIMDDFDRTAMTILDMDPQWRAQRRYKVGKNYTKVQRAYRIDGQTGQALFVKACAACHTIGQGDLVGPDLKGVTARRQRDWLIRFLVAPERMRENGDPIAVTLADQYPGVMMPNLGLSETDAGDLLSYLEAVTQRLDGQVSQAAPPGQHHDH